MNRRVVSLWLPTFATDRLISRRRNRWPATPGRQASPPLATVTAAYGGLRVDAVSPAAEAAGVRPGLSLADARALAPDLATVAADPAADRRELESLARWCGRYTPWTAVDGDGGGPGAGGVWLDIGGCAHLFGGEAALLGDLIARLASFGFRGLAAVADTPGAAWAVARFAEARMGAATVIPPGDSAAALAPLPVAGLRLAPATVEDLRQMGLRRIGELLALPRAPLAARFGGTLLRRLDEALGRTDEPLSPLRPPPPLRVRVAFAEPIGRPQDIAGALGRLLAEICASLERTHQGVRRLVFTLYRADGTTASAGIGTSRPTREVAHLERLFREKLEGLDAGFGVDAMTLAATAVDPLGATQTAFDRIPGDRAAADDADPIARLIDRLGNRLGAAGVVRLVPHPSHVPERACREVSALAGANPAPPAEAARPSPAPPRPIHLLPWPEPIEVVAPVPDDPPAMFRWRRNQHRVVRAEGPERIGPEWWLEDPRMLSSQQQRSRDYYRVEDAAGRRFWLYRDGCWRPGVRPRWYLHGFFP